MEKITKIFLLINFLTFIKSEGNCPKLPKIDTPINLFHEYFSFIYNAFDPVENSKSIRLLNYTKNNFSREEKFVFEILYLKKNKGRKRFIGIETKRGKKSGKYIINSYIHSKYFNSVKRFLGLYDIEQSDSIFCENITNKFWVYFDKKYLPGLKELDQKVVDNGLDLNIDSSSSKNDQNFQNVQNYQNAQNFQNVQNVQNVQNLKNLQNLQNKQSIGNILNGTQSVEHINDQNNFNNNAIANNSNINNTINQSSSNNNSNTNNTNSNKNNDKNIFSYYSTNDDTNNKNINNSLKNDQEIKQEGFSYQNNNENNSTKKTENKDYDLSKYDLNLDFLKKIKNKKFDKSSHYSNDIKKGSNSNYNKGSINFNKSTNKNQNNQRDLENNHIINYIKTENKNNHNTENNHIKNHLKTQNQNNEISFMSKDTNNNIMGYVNRLVNRKNLKIKPVDIDNNIKINNIPRISKHSDKIHYDLNGKSRHHKSGSNKSDHQNYLEYLRKKKAIGSGRSSHNKVENLNGHGVSNVSGMSGGISHGYSGGGVNSNGASGEYEHGMGTRSDHGHHTSGGGISLGNRNSRISGGRGGGHGSGMAVGNRNSHISGGGGGGHGSVMGVGNRNSHISGGGGGGLGNGNGNGKDFTNAIANGRAGSRMSNEENKLLSYKLKLENLKKQKENMLNMKRKREIALQKILKIQSYKKRDAEIQEQNKKNQKSPPRPKKKLYLVRKTEFYDNIEMQRLETLKRELLRKGSLSDDQMAELEILSKQNNRNINATTHTKKLYKSGYFSGFIH